jgi:hypothetical protein
MAFLPELVSRRLIYARRQTDKREFSGVCPVISPVSLYGYPKIIGESREDLQKDV